MVSSGEPQEEGPAVALQTDLRTLLVCVPMRKGLKDYDIESIVERSLGALMSQAPTRMNRKPKPIRLEWWQILPRHMSYWQFDAAHITNPSGTSSILGAITREFGNRATTKYIQPQEVL